MKRIALALAALALVGSAAHADPTSYRYPKTGQYFMNVSVGAGVTHAAEQFFPLTGPAYSATDLGVEITWLRIVNNGSANAQVQVYPVSARPAVGGLGYMVVDVPAFTTYPICGVKIAGVRVTVGGVGGSVDLIAER